MSKKDERKGSRKSGSSKQGLNRREFVKLVGGTGVAVSAGVLDGGALLEAQAPAGGVVVGPGAAPLTLRINGQPKRVTVEPRVTLLDALRNHLDLTGAKKVCDRGTCGACTVIMNGQAVYSCSVLAIDVAERPGHPAADIQTIEGLAPEDQLHAVSAAFVENDAQQCGFCTPGFVMASKAYLDRHPHPTYEQVQHALGGNLCRCGTYMGVRKAVLDAAMQMKGGRA
ncbi:MAG TPA: (2Fe-2S)-binding protein [Candidatus Acidoferrales bacterium]|nr:(2Fe-2S)-binding protein [Candidatus Acidoferrales bacterium]